MPQVACPRCRNLLQKAPGVPTKCARCGYVGAAAADPARHSPAQPAAGVSMLVAGLACLTFAMLVNATVAIPGVDWAGLPFVVGGLALVGMAILVGASKTKGGRAFAIAGLAVFTVGRILSGIAWKSPASADLSKLESFLWVAAVGDLLLATGIVLGIWKVTRSFERSVAVTGVATGAVMLGLELSSFYDLKAMAAARSQSGVVAAADQVLVYARIEAVAICLGLAIACATAAALARSRQAGRAPHAGRGTRAPPSPAALGAASAAQPGPTRSMPARTYVTSAPRPKVAPGTRPLVSVRPAAKPQPSRPASPAPTPLGPRRMG